jgi:hypothetical protein
MAVYQKDLYPILLRLHFYLWLGLSFILLQQDLLTHHLPSCTVNAVKKYQDDSFFYNRRSYDVSPRATFCHELLAVLGEMVIKHCLFDKDFDFSLIQKRTNDMSNSYSGNDCCIGNNQQLLDGS